MKQLFIGLLMFAGTSIAFASNDKVKKVVKILPPDTCTITYSITINGHFCSGTGTASDCTKAAQIARDKIDCQLL